MPTHYRDSDHNNQIKEFKNLVNYSKNDWDKNQILNKLLLNSGGLVDWREFYLTEEELIKLVKLGMEIGSHSHSHKLLSNLTPEEQYQEIKLTHDFLSDLLGKEPNKFCYPYGRPISYNKTTLSILKEFSYHMGVSVENSEISHDDIINRPLELPRFDCNSYFKDK